MRQILELLPSEDRDLLVKALVGLLCGLLIGIERALRRSPPNIPPAATIRTLAFIGLGSSLAVGAFVPAQPQVVAGALTGIGFLGTGIILRRETGDAVNGVTTAAGVFFIAAVGAIAGVGRLWTGAAASIVAVVLLEAGVLLPPLIRWLQRSWRHRRGKGAMATGLKHWWKSGAAPNDYEFGLAEETFRGQPAVYLRSIMQPARNFGVFCQTIRAKDYRGKRIQFSGALKATNVTGGWGGLWLRVNGPRLEEILAIDIMEDRGLTGTTDWREHALVLEVAAEAATISFGAGLSGEGELLVSQLAFARVGREVPVTSGPRSPRQPKNLDFSQATGSSPVVRQKSPA